MINPFWIFFGTEKVFYAKLITIRNHVKRNVLYTGTGTSGLNAPVPANVPLCAGVAPEVSFRLLLKSSFRIGVGTLTCARAAAQRAKPNNRTRRLWWVRFFIGSTGGGWIPGL